MNTQMYTKFDKRMLIVNKILLAFLVLITVVPMAYILIASFMDPQALVSKGISFDPKDWTIEGYERVFSDKSILRGFLNSLFYSFAFAFITVAVSVMTAYPLSRKDLVGKKWINAFSGLHHVLWWWFGTYLPFGQGFGDVKYRLGHHYSWCSQCVEYYFG